MRSVLLVALWRFRWARKLRAYFVGQTILAAAGFKPALGRYNTCAEPPEKAAAGKIACPTTI